MVQFRSHDNAVQVRWQLSSVQMTMRSKSSSVQFKWQFCVRESFHVAIPPTSNGNSFHFRRQFACFQMTIYFNPDHTLVSLQMTVQVQFGRQINSDDNSIQMAIPFNSNDNSIHFKWTFSPLQMKVQVQFRWQFKFSLDGSSVGWRLSSIQMAFQFASDGNPFSLQMAIQVPFR